MSYDHWKTTNPEDEFLGSVYCDDEEPVVNWLHIENEMRRDIWQALFECYPRRNVKRYWEYPT